MDVLRLDEAAAAAQHHGETRFAYMRFDVMAQDEVAIALVAPDDRLGWRLTLLQGRYAGDLHVTSTGHPPRGARRQMANLVFHPAPATPDHEGASTVEVVRTLEGYEDDCILHPDAIRTIVRARQAQDSRIPNARPSPFSGLLQYAGIVGGVLALANTIAVIGLIATWGHTPQQMRHFVVSTTLVTLALLAMSPVLLSRLSRESQLFVRPVAQQQGRALTVRLAQMIILLAVMASINGLVAVA